MKVIWSKVAVKQLLNIIQYIEENSFESYADTLEKDILTKISQLPLIISITGPTALN